MGLLDAPVNLSTRIGRKAIAALDDVQTNGPVLANNNNQSWIFIGDSTGNAYNEWIFLLIKQLAARYPNIGFDYLGWTQSNIYATITDGGGWTGLNPTTAPAWSSTTTYASGSIVNCPAPDGTNILYWSAIGGNINNNPLTSPNWNILSSRIQIATNDYPTVTFRNGSVSGTSFEYMIARTIPQMINHNPDLVFINTGHNETTIVGKDFESRYMTALNPIMKNCPRAKIVLCAQNPQINPANNAGNYQSQRRSNIYLLAQQYGFDVLDAYQAFVNTGNNLSTYIENDGLHPNANGSILWANAASKALDSTKGIVSGFQSKNVFTNTEQNLLTNPYFNDYPTSPGLPTGWSGNNVTATKDTTNKEFGYSWATKMTPTSTSSGAGQVYISQQIASNSTDAVKYAGQWVIGYGRFWMSNALPTENMVRNARVYITDGRTSYTSQWGAYIPFSTPNSSGWFDVYAKFFVASNPLRLEVRFIADSATTPASTSIITIQKASFGLGITPIYI